jgi:DNA-binding IclR family transcriptional regulator
MEDAMKAEAEQSILSKAAGSAGRDEQEDSDHLPAKDRQFVTALARGLSILRAFQSSSEVLGNQELARRTSLPKPTISRLTHTLLELGYLRVVKDREKYQLGPAVLALGMSFFRSNSFAQIARPYLQELANQTQAHVALGIREGLNSVYMQLWRGVGQSITISREIGFNLPIAKSGMGMAMVAALPDHERAEVMQGLEAQVGEDWPRLSAELERGRKEIERHGFCVALGAWHPDINAVAAPVIAPETGTLYVINISGPAFIMTEEVLRNDTGPKLRSTINRMRETGAVDWPPIFSYARNMM